MKIWLTRHNAGSLISGGLERVQVWFRQPTYVEVWRYPHEDSMPFGPDYTDINGRLRAGWEVMQSGCMWIDQPLSFGKLFGYVDREEPGENDLAKLVWVMLCDHFGTEELRDWKDTPERDHRKWIIELELKIDAYVPMK